MVSFTILVVIMLFRPQGLFGGEEMTRLYIFLAAVLAVLLVLPLFLEKYVLGIFVMIFFYAYVGQSWNILTGYTGHISLGHALYVGVGAYTSTLSGPELRTQSLDRYVGAADFSPVLSPFFSDFWGFVSGFEGFIL